MSGQVKVGVQLRPYGQAAADLVHAAAKLDQIGVDSIWVWDHFFPLHEPADAAHYEAWTMLATIATRTSRATIGTLVSAMPYRNPDLLAHMAFTLSELCAGRLVVGVGAGWAERDFREYGYPYGTVGNRSRQLADGVGRLRARLDRLQPERHIPILVGGGGERMTMHIAARYADAWNGFGPAKLFARKNRILDQWCERVGRDPAQIHRSALVMGTTFDPSEFAAAGASEVIVSPPPPLDVDLLCTLVDHIRQTD